MKSLFLSAVVLTMLSINWASAQATFIFQNYQTSAGIDAPVFDAGGNRLFGDNYVAVLYGGLTADNLTLAMGGAASMEPVAFIRTYNAQVGYFAQAGFVHFNTVPPGEFAWLQVRAWDLRLGQTYDDVASLGLGGYGASSLFQARGGDIGPMGQPPQPLIGLQSFSLVPEPSTWALLAFGVGVLFWKCNRRRDVKPQQHSGK